MRNKILYTILVWVTFLSCNQPNYRKEAIALNDKGAYYFNQNNLDSALWYFNQSTIKNPNYLIAYQNKANVLIKMKKYELAVQEVDKLVHVQAYAQAVLFKGILYDRLEKSNQADSNYRYALELFQNELKNASAQQTPNIKSAIALNYYLLGDSLTCKAILDSINQPTETLLPADSLLKNLNNKTKIIDMILSKGD